MSRISLVYPVLGLCLLYGCAWFKKPTFEASGLDAQAGFPGGFDSVAITEKSSGWAWNLNPLTTPDPATGKRLKISYYLGSHSPLEKSLSLYDGAGNKTYQVRMLWTEEPSWRLVERHPDEIRLIVQRDGRLGADRDERISWRFSFIEAGTKDTAGDFTYTLEPDETPPVFRGSLNGDSLSVEWSGIRPDGQPLIYDNFLKFWLYAKLSPIQLKFNGCEILRFARRDTTLALVIPRDPRWLPTFTRSYTAYFRKDLSAGDRRRVLELLPVYNMAIADEIRDED